MPEEEAFLLEIVMYVVKQSTKTVARFERKKVIFTIEFVLCGSGRHLANHRS